MTRAKSTTDIDQTVNHWSLDQFVPVEDLWGTQGLHTWVLQVLEVPDTRMFSQSFLAQTR